MIKFLLKGLIRDKSRSRLPVIVVAIGVMLTVFLHAYIKGFMGDMIEMNARFSYRSCESNDKSLCRKYEPDSQRSGPA